jgi:hypothetical protein
VTHHAFNGMMAERPAIRPHRIERTLEEPDHDDGGTAWKKFGRRTIIVHYTEEADVIIVRSVSATRVTFRA